MPVTAFDLAETLAARLTCPVVVYDTALRIVAFSSHRPDADPVRVSIILARQGSTRAMEMIRASGVQRSRRPVRIPHDERTGTPARIVFAVRRRDRLVGYVVYVDPTPDADPGEAQLDALMSVHDELAVQLARQVVEQQVGREQLAVLLRELLAGDAAAAGNDLVAQGFLGAGAHTTVVLTTGPDRARMLSPGQRLTMEDTLAELARQVPGKSCGAVLDDRAVAVVPHPPDPDKLADTLTRVAAGALAAGVGGPRDGVDEMRGSHHEAAVAARAAWLDPAGYGPVARWAGLGIDRLLLQLPLHAITAADLPEPVQQLLAAGTGPDLPATLDCYLDAGGDAQETARRLNLHRSSLYYRLDRIRELVGVDLADGTVRRELHVGLRVARLAGLTSG